MLKKNIPIAIICILMVFGFFVLTSTRSRNGRLHGDYIPRTVTGKKRVIVEQGVNYKEETIYYSVRGDTEQKVRESMNVNSPVPPNDANTKWNIHWKYKHSIAGGDCSVDDLKVDVKIVYTYPNFVDLESVSDRLQNKWQTYMQALVLHEMGHRNNNVNMAKAIHKTLSSFSSYSSCEELDKKVDEAAQAEIKKGNDHDIQYDTETHHGETQGAKFP